jgi:hypothetical protein
MMPVRQRQSFDFQIRHCQAWLSGCTLALADKGESWMATKRSARAKSRSWTKEDIRELREHSRRKSPVKKIAKAMKRTTGALRIKAVRLGFRDEACQ